MSEKVLKVLSNVAQGLTETQKAQARSNIGCAGSYTAGTGIAINDHSIINTAPHVQADWTAASGTSAEILNKPTIGDATLTIAQDGTPVATFSANATGDVTANITSGGTHVVTRNNGQGGYVETAVPKLILDTDFNTIVANNTDIGVYAPPPNTPVTDKVLSVSAGSDVPQWVNMPVSGTKIQTRTYPYTTAVDITNLTIFNPGSVFGSVVSDQNSNNIGYFVPKYNAPTDLGKVLTVVSDDGYRCEWRDPTGGVPQITPMGLVTYYASGDDYINMEDNVAYFIETNSGGSFTIHLGTLSRQTIHSKIYLVGTQANCVTMTVVYEDEAGQVCQLNFVYGDSQSDTYYGLDVYARLVTIGGGGSISFDTTMCRVIDYPCQNRDYFSSDNNNIGLIVDYVEPL